MRRDVVIGKHLDLRVPAPFATSAFDVEKARKRSPEPFPETLPVRAKPKERAARESFQLMREQGRVGCDHDDDRSGLVLAYGVVGELAPHRDTRD